jgi:hypothetical protein
MAFISKILSENEKLIGIARVHWIHVAKGAACLLAPALAWSILVQLLAKYVYYNIPAPLADALHLILYYAFCGFELVGIMLFVLAALHFLTTEMALTSKRVIYKTGWLFVKVKEVDLEEIKAADIDTGWFGRFLNYGYLILDSRFVGTVNLASISHPYGFLRLLNTVRGQLKQDTVNVVLEGHESITPKDVIETLTEKPEPPPPQPRPPEPAPAPGPFEPPQPEQPPQPPPQPPSIPSETPEPAEPMPFPPPPDETPDAPPVEVPVQNKLRLHDKILESFSAINLRRAVV